MPAFPQARFPLLAATLVLVTGVAAAQVPPADSGAVTAKVTSPAGSFSRRAADDPRFTPVAADADVFTGHLLVGLPGASLRAESDAVELTCRADFGGKSPLPILETAVVLHDDPTADLAFTLDRGRVDLANRKLTGAATVRVRFRNESWKIVLDRPGSRAAVETVGRWAPGTLFYRADAPADHAPAASVVVLVLAGTAEVTDGKVTLAMTAPPGPAMVSWDSTNPAPLSAARLDRVPDWSAGTPSADPGEQAVAAAVDKLRAALAADRGSPAVAFASSADPVERRVGLIAAGAFDDLDPVVRAVRAAPDAATAATAISVLRHWLGRGPGQDLKFYQYLRDTGLRPAEAENVVYLLHGLPADARGRPETYEVLIEYLLSDRPLVRNLAAWHLARLAPAGGEISLAPNAGPDDARRAYDAWKALIPPGRLPPAAADPTPDPEPRGTP